MTDQVTDNSARSRFELAVGEQVAFADYRREAGRLVIYHVETPVELRGGGVAGRLMEGVLGIARQDGLKVVPLCGYASAYMRRHPVHQNLLA